MKPYECRVCKTKFSQAGNMMKHMESTHNSEFCAAKKIEEEKVRALLVGAGYIECFELGDVLPPVGCFKREHRIEFDCVEANSTSAATGNAARSCRIDFIINVMSTYIFLEVDEQQHRFGYGASLSCDMKRMSDVSATLLLCEDGARMPPIHWLRYNSHGYRVGGETVRLSKEVREAALLASIDAVQTSPPPEQMAIEYVWLRHGRARQPRGARERGVPRRVCRARLPDQARVIRTPPPRSDSTYPFRSRLRWLVGRSEGAYSGPESSIVSIISC